MSDDAKGSVFCPKCGTADNEVRRRRRCSDCNGRFTTYESIERAPSRSKEKQARELLGQLADMLGIGRK